MTSSHTRTALPAAAQTTGTKKKWRNSCISLQNNPALAASPPLCVHWPTQRTGKKARHSWIRPRKQRNFWMEVYDPHTDYHFASVSVFRTAHKEIVLKAITNSVWASWCSLSWENSVLSWVQIILFAIARTVPNLHTAQMHSRVGWGKRLWNLLRCHLFHEILLVIIIKCQLSVIAVCNGKSLLRTCSATCWWSTLTLNSEAML